MFYLPLLPITFSYESSSNRRTSEIDFSPLEYHFKRILASDRSATSITQKDRSFSCQMVILDFLRAVIECWIVFLAQITRKTTVYSAKLDSRSRAYNLSAFKELQKTARDLDLAIRYTIDTATASLGSSQESLPKSQLKAIELEALAKLRAMNNIVNDYLGTLDSISDVTKALVEEDQARSVKRLTLLAAIFLPLSLASSLLSMSTRTRDLGLLWYDFIGISSLLVIVMFFIYQSLRAQDIVKTCSATTMEVYLDRAKKRLPRKFWKSILGAARIA